MHAVAPPVTKSCPRAASGLRITLRHRAPVTAASLPALAPAAPAARLPDLDDPQIRALPIAALALAFAVAGVCGANR